MATLLHNLHLVFSQLNCPFAEYVPDAELDGDTYFWHLFDGNPVVADGSITLDGTRPPTSSTSRASRDVDAGRYDFFELCAVAIGRP